jgi:adenylate cyclase class 2
VEVEIKVAVEDAARAARELEKLGASCVVPRSFEDNVLFDRPDRALTGEGRLLRLRVCAGRATLTAKAPADADRPGYKVRRETEADVPDAPALADALRAAGFGTLWRYQKWRTTYHWQGAEIVVDETPAGAFLEIEGATEAIDRVAAALGVDPSHRLTGTYRDVWEAHCASRGAAVGDMVFPEEPRP